MSKLTSSLVGTFTARSGLSLVELLGVLYVARLAGATTLGTYALFRAAFVVARLVIDAGTREATIKRLAEERDQGSLLVASLAVRGVLLVPVVVAVLVFREGIATYVGSPIVVPFLLALAVLQVFVETVYAGLHGERRVGRAELTLFVNVAAKVAVWAVALPLGYGLAGILVGHVVGSLLQIAAGVRFLTIRPRLPGRRQFVRLVTFGKYSWLGSLRERAWIWTDTVVLGFFVVNELVGVYELSWQLSAGFFLVSSAISSTLFANVDHLRREGGEAAVREVLEESLVFTGIAAIPGVVGAALLAEPVLSAVGASYAAGAFAFVVLIVARLAHSYEVVFAKVINAYDRPDLTFRVDVAFLALNVVGNVVAVATIGWQGAAVATAVSMCVRLLLSYHYLGRLLDVPVPTPAIGREVLAAVAMGAALFAVLPDRPLSALETALAVTGGAALYSVLLLAVVARVRTKFRRLVLAVR